MEILLDKRSIDYIKANTEDNSIHIITREVGSGWCKTSEPLVVMGRPYNEEIFKHHEVEGINVYTAPRLIARNNQCRITFTKILWHKRLNVDGIIV